jgi:Flp pilus assembly protein TadD
MTDLTTDQWKSFLNARILQEQGKDAEALDIFDKLLAANPANPHLRSSKAFALERLNRRTDAVAARIASAYSKAAAALSGDADRPENWTAELNNLLNEVQGVEKGRAISAALVAW